MHKRKAELITQKEQAKLFKMLSHPVRLAILEILVEDEACVCHLEAALGYPQPYLSQQLAVLRDGGFIGDRRDGWNVYYQLIQPQIGSLLDLAAGLLQLPSDRKPYHPLVCPCPKCKRAVDSIFVPSPILSGEKK